MIDELPPANNLFEYAVKVDPATDSAEIEALLLSLANRKQTISLLNYYNEMPVISKVAVSIFDKGKFEVSPRDIHMEVLCKQYNTFVLLPSGESFLAKCHTVNPSRGYAVLAEFSYVKILASLRESLRVAIDPPVDVILEAGELPITGGLQNISLGGCCVTSLYSALSPGNTVNIHLHLTEHDAQHACICIIPATIIRKDFTPPAYLYGLRFELSKTVESELAYFINRKQLAFIKQLHIS